MKHLAMISPRRTPYIIAAVLALVASYAHAAEEERAQILVIKGNTEDDSHAFITKALAPRRRSAMFEVTVAEVDYLAKEPLDGFATIFLNDVAKLSDDEHQALDKAVKAGAGACFLLGPRAEVDHFNKVLYADGEGPFPLPLGKPQTMPEGKSGIVAAKHPVLNVFEGDGKAMLDIVLVNRCHVPADGWQPESVKGLNVIARSAAGQPIAVSKSHGDGNVVVFLFVPDRRWANWHFYPAWVVMMHELQTFMTEY
mgnify:CR=1 FL=1